MTTEIETRVEARIPSLIENYRDEAAILIMLTQRAEIALARDPQTPTRDKLLALALDIQKRQLALLKGLDAFMKLLETYTVP